MRTRAAVLHAPRTDYQVEEIELDEPKEGEVLVRLVASGLCHSDEHLWNGDIAVDQAVLDAMGWQQFPIIMGHEGAGIVEAVGPGVTELAVGDHVVTSFVPSCGHCLSCASGHQNLCDLGATLLSGHQLDGTSRHHALDGTDIATMCCLGTFAEHTVVGTSSLVKIDPEIPLEVACLVSCGVTTGWGSAAYAGGVATGDTVVVVGVGGVGMNAVQGASLAGATRVVAVDPVRFKTDSAAEFGATHTASSVEEATALVNQLTHGRNAEVVIITVGTARGEDLASYMAMVAKGGTLVVTAMGSIDDSNANLSLFEISMMQKSLKGAIFGGGNPRYDIPRLLQLYADGRLKLDELVTSTYSLDQVNEGYQDLRDGKNIRGVVRL
jgi:NDMA-dependent alcohol dehydrogenase